MSDRSNTSSSPSQPDVYEIRIMGHLGAHWAGRFEGMCMTLAEGGETLLTGQVADQAALFSLLRKVRDLGMPLVSVKRIDTVPR